MQAEFSNYIRRDTRAYAFVLLPVFLFFSILSFLATFSVKEEKTKQELLQVSILSGLPSLLSLIVLFFSYKRAALMDLLTPVFLVSASIMFVLVNVTGVCGEQNSVMRQQQINLHLIIYANFAQFILSTWMANFISRILYT